jgi:hypothetical protein
MGFESVRRKADELDAPLREFWSPSGDFAELSGANRGEIRRMGEENRPGVADPVVEFDRACGGLRLKVGCY